MIKIVLTFLAILLLSSNTALWAETIISSMSQNRVSITANFDGSEILIFGAIKQNSFNKNLQADVLIEVIGPATPETVREKQKIFGIWINSNPVSIKLVPSFYALFGTKNLDELLPKDQQRLEKIGIHQSIKTSPTNSETKNAIQALLRIKSKDGAYNIETQPIKFEGGTLFSTVVNLPSNLVEGDYNAKIHLIRNQKVISSTVSVFEVQKIGLERWLHNMAHNQPFKYGLLSLLMALAFGWIAAEAFKLLRR